MYSNYENIKSCNERDVDNHKLVQSIQLAPLSPSYKYAHRSKASSTWVGCAFLVYNVVAFGVKLD